MTEFRLMYTMGASAMGALVAIYVILSVLILLGAYSLVRLAILAKRLRNRPKAEAPKKELPQEVAPAKEEAPAVNCDECAKVAELKEEVARLEDRIRELEAAPVAVVAAMEEKTLKESLAAASLAGKTRITKKSIAAYVREKYDAAAEVNERGAKTSNGKLPLSDNHFIYLADGAKVCFTYVYDTPEGGVVSLVRLDAARAAKIAEKHSVVSHSVFPKNKAKDWYSVVADDTFTEEEYYAIFDASIDYLRGCVVAVEEAPTEAPIEERSLKESLAAAKVAHSGKIFKQTIIDYLTAKYGAEVEINHRGAKTGNGKLPLSDNHFIRLADGTKACFTYVYDTPEGGVVALIRLDGARAATLSKKHASLSHSTFPKNKANDWYSVIADGSATEEDFYAVFDRSIEYLTGCETVAEVAPLAEKTLKESLAAARVAGKTKISKKSIAAYIAEKYADGAEINERGAKTSNGKLPLSDNHFIYLADGTKVCFTYVYDTPEGGVVSLVRLDAKRAAKLAEKHSVVSRSAFPKNKAKDWYSVVADDTFTEEEYYAVFDASIAYLKGVEYTAEVAPLAEKSLKESLAAARVAGKTEISKRSIAAYIAEKYADGAEINERGAKTSNGKLPLSDNHFIYLADGTKVCFTYVYDTPEGGVVSLVRLDAARAAKLAEKHSVVSRSAFPKNKAKDWYSVVADGTFTEEEYYAVFDASVAYLRGDAFTEEVAPMAEKSLKESLAAAREVGKTTISKKSIAAYIAEKYANGAEINERGAKTSNGKLPLSDNHFIYLADGTKVCFTYVYDTPEGGVVSLVRLDAARAAKIAEKHSVVSRSAFPKNKAKDWYSVVADGTFTEEEYYAVFDASVAYLKGDAEETIPETAPIEEVAAAVEVPVEEPIADVPAVGAVTKKSIVAYLDKKYLDKVELHPRKKVMDSGKLFVPDNHFALRGEERICFSYVYEDAEGTVTILVRLGEEEGNALIAAHDGAVTHSRFPRNKAKDWYKIVVDDTFTVREVREVLDRSLQYALSL